MNKSVSRVRSAIRGKVEDIVNQHRESACRRLEGRALTMEMLGKHSYAGEFYKKAAEKAEKLGNNNDKIRLILRAIDSYETHGDMCEETAKDFGSKKSPELAQTYVSDARTAYANAAYFAYVINEPTLLQRSKRLLSQAERNESILEKNVSHDSPSLIVTYDEVALNKIRFLRRVFGD